MCCFCKSIFDCPPQDIWKLNLYVLNSLHLIGAKKDLRVALFLFIFIKKIKINN